VIGLRRLGKRIVWSLDGDLFAVFHLMIAGRFRWRDRGAAIPGKVGLAAFDFPDGTLLLTEAGSKKRASLRVARGAAALRARGADAAPAASTQARALRAAREAGRQLAPADAVALAFDPGT
jgi:formamidopyrimidine-DNA glycosylase